MRSVSPNIPGADEFDIAEDQLDFVSVRACLVEDLQGNITRIIRYRLNDAERKKIAEGADLIFGTPGLQRLQPHWISVDVPWPVHDDTSHDKPPPDYMI